MAEGSDRLKQHHQQVVGIMKDNVQRVLERDQKLSDLDTRAEDLQAQSRQFEAVSSRVRRKYFWQNIKMWIILGGVAVVFLIVIISKFKWSLSNCVSLSVNCDDKGVESLLDSSSGFMD